MNIRVVNLSPETSLSALRGSFEMFGMVTDVTISTFRVNGIYKALGFVEMPSSDRGRAAIAGLQGKELGGIFLAVREE